MRELRAAWIVSSCWRERHLLTKSLCSPTSYDTPYSFSTGRCRLELPPRFVGCIWHVNSHSQQLWYCLHHQKLFLYRGHHKRTSCYAQRHNNQLTSSHPQTRLKVMLIYPRIRNCYILILNGDYFHPTEPLE